MIPSICHCHYAAATFHHAGGRTSIDSKADGPVLLAMADALWPVSPWVCREAKGIICPLQPSTAKFHTKKLYTKKLLGLILWGFLMN